MAKKPVFYFITLGLIFLVFETIGYFSFFLFDDIYDHRKEVLARIREIDTAEEKPLNLDALLGWTYRGPQATANRTVKGWLSSILLTETAPGHTPALTQQTLKSSWLATPTPTGRKRPTMTHSPRSWQKSLTCPSPTMPSAGIALSRHSSI